ncbi:MAG: hypothetical protein AAFV25_09415 [Bacteroidota bacterium]
MKKFYRNIALFSLPVLLLLLVWPMDSRQQFQGLSGDCFGHGLWIHDRLSDPSNKQDIVFIGSSRTLNGVDDSLIQAELPNGDQQVLNLGYCRLGRNISSVLLKKTLQAGSIKQLVLEVREDEDRYSHPVFPYMASTKEVCLANPFFNPDLFSDCWTHFVYKLELTQDQLYDQQPLPPLSTATFGQARQLDTMPLAQLEQAVSQRRTHKVSGWQRDFYLNFPRSYLQHIHQICQDNYIQLSFLYLPAFGNASALLKEANTYQEYGDLWLSPAALFEEPTHWYDDQHLNQTGANKLSQWLSQRLQQ